MSQRNGGRDWPFGASGLRLDGTAVARILAGPCARTADSRMTLPTLLQDRLSLPVIGAPMFIVSGPELVIAQCKAGIVGSFPALNARPAHCSTNGSRSIKAELAAFRSANPGRNRALRGQPDRACLQRPAAARRRCLRQHEVPITITSLRAPTRGGGARARLWRHRAARRHHVRHAKKALDEGVDGLILVCAGAGGHAGTLSPFALVREVRRFFDGAIVLSGAISHGSSVLAAQAVGADLAYIGTRFIASAEANAKPEYKQMLVDSTAADVVYTSYFSGVHGNYLKTVGPRRRARPRQPAGRRERQDELRQRSRAAEGLARHLELPARASAKSPTCRQRPRSWRACGANTTTRGGGSADERHPRLRRAQPADGPPRRTRGAGGACPRRARRRQGRLRCVLPAQRHSALRGHVCGGDAGRLCRADELALQGGRGRACAARTRGPRCW